MRTCHLRKVNSRWDWGKRLQEWCWEWRAHTRRQSELTQVSAVWHFLVLCKHPPAYNWFLSCQSSLSAEYVSQNQILVFKCLKHILQWEVHHWLWGSRKGQKDYLIWVRFSRLVPSSHSDFWPRWQTILLPCEMQNTRNNPDWIVLGWWCWKLYYISL